MIKLLCLAIVAGMSLEGSKGADVPELTCNSLSPIYCWTDWFDSDKPSGQGDNENLSKLRRRYPDKICPKPVDIEARTLSGLTPEQAGDIIEINDVQTGFICKKRDQPDKRCGDYKIRFSCPPPYCADTVCWTRWYDRDNPSGSGDWETLRDLHRQYPGQICKRPLYLEVVTTSRLTPAIYTGDRFHIFSPTEGFVCRNSDQERGICEDYKVRFGCPCD